jgi:hypothetical protein
MIDVFDFAILDMLYKEEFGRDAQGFTSAKMKCSGNRMPLWQLSRNALHIELDEPILEVDFNVCDEEEQPQNPKFLCPCRRPLESIYLCDVGFW